VEEKGFDGLGELPGDARHGYAFDPRSGEYIYIGDAVSRPGRAQVRMAPLGPNGSVLTRQPLAPGELPAPESPEDRLVRKFRGAVLHARPPSFCSPPFWAINARIRSGAGVFVGVGLTVTLLTFTPNAHELFRFHGLAQFASDVAAAADSTWRVRRNDTVREELVGISSDPTRDVLVPIFVHGGSDTRVTVDVTAGAVAFNAGATLVGYRYASMGGEVPGSVGTLQD